MKRILVRADDLGCCESVNYGIDPKVPVWCRENGVQLLTYGDL